MRFTLIIFVVISLGLTYSSIAQVPNKISYEGVLAKPSGSPAQDGVYTFKFELYDSSVAGNLLWTEFQPDSVRRGSFNAILGEFNPLPAVFHRPLFLQISVTDGADPDIILPSMFQPRAELTSAPYALQSQSLLGPNSTAVGMSAIAGGESNTSSGNTSVVAGGTNNTASSDYSFVGGGNHNRATGGYSAVTGGSDNLSVGSYSAVGGGDRDSAIDLYATVPGGRENAATGIGSFAAGAFAKSYHRGSFVWSDGSSPGGFASTDINQFLINASSGVGIGTNMPSYALDVAGPGRMRVRQGSNGTAGVWFYQTTPADDPAFVGMQSDNVVGFYGSGGALWGMVMNTATGNVGIGTTTPASRLDVNGQANMNALQVNGQGTMSTLLVNGQATVNILQIKGGSDLAEPFALEQEDEVEPGTVLAIDERNPGELRVCAIAYDPKVAGIASGAGGIHPGITLEQKGTTSGNTLVAIAGRVYCKAEAGSFPIQAGDLLTTSAIPGYAMKAADNKRSRGAIIGKAMTSLKQGRGLVLVLVNLQ